MKSLKRILVAAAVALLALAPAAAQVRFGVKAGVALNDLHFNKDIVNDLSSTSNRAGFTGGVMAEVQVPIVGLCIDGSVLYAHRSAELKGSKSNEVFKRDYIDIPVNLKYKFNILGLSSIFTPYVHRPRLCHSAERQGPERIHQQDPEHVVERGLRRRAAATRAGVGHLRHRP